MAAICKGRDTKTQTLGGISYNQAPIHRIPGVVFSKPLGGDSYMPSNNPRYRNYHARQVMRERFKRLGNPCALCGKPIDYSLPAGDPMSYELDEILPISRGGSPIDPDNLQAVHRICNQRKGNKLLNERTAMNKTLTTSRNWWSLE